MRISLLALSLLGIAGAPPAPSRGIGTRCSLSSFAIAKSRATAYFLGEAGADTVVAGAGDLKFTGQPGHSGHPAPAPRTIYGQTARVRRLGGLGVDSALAALAASDSTVVLVPWDYGADCGRVAWGGSFRFIRPGASGLFVGRLRHPSLWVGGRPTLDVSSPWRLPYPSAAHREEVDADTGASPMLDAEEAFELYEGMPDERTAREARRAGERMSRWAIEHPRLAGRYPASLVITTWRQAAALDTLQSAMLPLAGTFHLTARLGRDSTSFYVRTAQRPMVAGAVALTDSAASGVAPRVVVTFMGSARTAASEDAFDKPTRTNGAEDAHWVFYHVAERPDSAPGGALVWRGCWEVVRRILADERNTRIVARAGSVRREIQAAEGRCTQRLSAIFRLLPTGELEVEQRLAARGGAELELRGRRISTRTLPDER